MRYDKINGIWTSGMDKQIVDAIKAAARTVRADRRRRRRRASSSQLLDPTNFAGPQGRAVTNTAAVGGAGVTLALKLLNGETVTADPAASPAEHRSAGPGRGRQPDPRRSGEAQGVAVRAGPGSDSGRSASPIDGWTTYDSRHSAVACKGPAIALTPVDSAEGDRPCRSPSA